MKGTCMIMNCSGYMNMIYKVGALHPHGTLGKAKIPGELDCSIRGGVTGISQ